ncbi:HYR domain-containing protein [Gramella sp. GC03-9]|uniref:HYR domain-containing protein n=1 Tax=Christiangramia oceanisediminis TaxID=2920386 RepID=A0A9X2KWR2_9FLAO|nr:HYR domain-containing protein [Gramella oceanisediminis]MCP9199754.1 HYR domain-containing protein [Gramella oceanisediminis]
MNEIQLADLNIGFSGIDTSELPISIDTDSENNVFVLTFGNGIQKRNEAGGNPVPFINGLNSPVDFYIDDSDFFYVADYSEEGSCGTNGKIKKYNSEGVKVNEFYTGFYRPLGVAVGRNGNIYVAEYNPSGSGCENTEMSRVSVYNQDGTRIDHNPYVIRPYRIAVNSQGVVYVSQEGGDNPAVLIMNSELDIQGELPEVQSPGSVVVDAFDFIHVNEYAGRLDFSKFVNFDNIGFSEAQDIAQDIDNGIDDNAFGIRIYRPDQTFAYLYKQEIDFPVDIAFNSCDKMYVNNGFVDGGNVIFIGYVPNTIEFDLEIYRRTPSMDVTPPLAVCISDPLVFNIGVDETITIQESDIDSGSFDLCGEVELRLDKVNFSSTDEGDNLVTLTVIDNYGQQSTCQAIVTINVDEDVDTDDPVISCPDDISQETDPGECGAIVNFPNATATDNSGTASVTRTDNTGLDSGDLFPVGTTTISFRATDAAGNFSDCSFTITIDDNEDPTISCPENINQTVAFGETSKIVNYTVGFDDNCKGFSVQQTAGIASGEEFPVGETITNTFVITDASGNTEDCSFTVTVTVEEDTEAPVINCPDDIFQGTDPGQCRAIVNFVEVTATDNSGSDVSITRIDNTEFDNGDYFPVGTTTLSYRATDEAGNSSECSFTISIEDNEAPVISNCIDENPSFTILEGESHIIDDYTTQVLVSDNCDNDPLITQQPPRGTEITSDQQVILKAVDESGNESELCSFTVEINVEEAYEFRCIGELTVLLGEEAQNSSVTEIPTSEFITSDISNLDLELNVQQFTCDDIGTFDLEINASHKETGEEYSCTVQVSVEDVGAPLIICPAEPISLDLPEDGYLVPDFFENRVSDNCNTIEQLELVQDLEPGTILDSSGTYTINLTATDTYDNVETCVVTVILEENDNTTPEITCPDKQTLDVGDNCEIPLPDYTDLVTTNPDLEVIQTPAPGTMISSTQQINFSATLNGETVSCEFELEVINPANDYSMLCPLTGVNIYEIDASEDGVIVNFDEPTVTGACGEVEIEQTQGPASGSLFPVGTHLVSFTAIDEARRQLDCSFEIVVIRENQLSLSCPGEYEIFADENCQYVIPDFSEIISFTPEDAIIEQSIEPGATTITNADPFITIRATYEGETESCDIYLLLVDETPPVVNCLADRTVEVEEGEIYSLPDFRNELDRSDNCGIAEITQQPIPGTELEDDTIIFLNITDEAGNTTQCDFLLSIREKGSIDFSCIIEEYELSPNEDCEYRMPDFSTILEYGPEDAEFTQAISPGTLLEEDTELQVSVSYEGEIKTCILYVSLVDDKAPEAVCVGQLDIVLEEGETRIITAEMIDNGSFDTCGEVSLSIDQSEFTSEDEGDNTVILTVTDEAGNTATCESLVRVIISDSNVNNPPVGIEDIYTTTVNTQLNISATDGVLANDYDLDDDELSVRLDTDVQNGNLQLNEDGSFIYTPDQDFIGQDYFTYIASDGELDSNIMFVSLYVIDDSGDFSCADQVVLNLGPDGAASLDISNLYSGDSDGLEFSISRQDFGCEDIGDNIVSLTYTGRLEGSCDITVKVIDDEPPVLNLQDISIDLNLEGVATINFQDINDGSFDACDPNVVYILSKNVFTCKEVGENLVRVTAEDASGNVSTAMVRVTVFVEEGICSEAEGSEYIFIYPNPNSGEFQVATPGDITISRIEIFDHRGRFVTARNFTENDTEYNMQVEGLQEAIYILKLDTNEGEVVKRMIFKH